jgi:hypothetical protein
VFYLRLGVTAPCMIALVLARIKHRNVEFALKSKPYFFIFRFLFLYRVSSRYLTDAHSWITASSFGMVRRPAPRELSLARSRAVGNLKSKPFQ